MSGWWDWASGVASAAQALAILVGGFWAYFKFIRGRTFAHRAETTVTAARLGLSHVGALKVTLSVKNVGLSKLPLRLVALTLVGIYAKNTKGDPLATEERQLGKPRRVFAAHGWIEAQETIEDEALILVPASGKDGLDEVLAFRLNCQVIERRRWRTGGLSWSSTTIVVPSEAAPPASPAGVQVILTTDAEGRVSSVAGQSVESENTTRKVELPVMTTPVSEQDDEEEETIKKLESEIGDEERDDQQDDDDRAGQQGPE
jgi:hypothetical protein